MYGYYYETNILFFLRLAKYLHNQDPAALEKILNEIHVTGNTAAKRAFITEGPLKGDAASFLANDALFVCVGGVNAIHGLKDTLVDLGVREVVEAMDMDQMTNENVRRAVLEMRREVQTIPGVKYFKYTWNPAYKGVDDYLLSRRAAEM